MSPGLYSLDITGARVLQRVVPNLLRGGLARRMQ